MTSEEKKDKRKAMITSLTIHALLLLIFLFFGLTTIQPKPEEGMMINFGNTDTGLGDTESDPAQSEVVEEQVEEEVQPVESVATPVEPIVEEQVVTQEMLEAIALQKAKKRQEKVEAEERAEEERIAAEKAKEQADKRAASAALFAKAKDGQGKGEGNTSPGGNQGSADGTPGAPHGLGGSGNGPSFNLGGRKMVSAPKIIDNSQKKGTVVVEILVDKFGTVMKATPGARGSTTADGDLERLARDAAMGTKFSPNPEAPIQQKGTMTFVFILE